MRRIYTLGETVLDIIFRDNLPVAANPGGSMLNASVTLGRLGAPVYFISEFGNDQVGNMSNKFLCSNGVNTDFCHRYDNGKSAIALAFLDEHQNASYSFYKLYPEKRLNIDIPLITKDDMLMFGSYYGISAEIRDTVLKLLNLAKNQDH
ncbi:MAG: hypothetical protein HC905_06020 [Bacteroidales bacterium]|nr:hypothetical protein [Bacteroidales bacterium]